ncbi:TlpA family protein disulfide reductase [Hymenobacter lapidarius]|nr:TlpA disulfide reductase family protein [Hymenobacter lapidarius]
MKRMFAAVVAVLGVAEIGHAQTGEQALAQYRAALGTLNTVAYHVQRIDTFPNKSVWNRKGQAIMQRDAASSVLGARFLGTRFDAARGYWYDGKVGYELDDKAKTFRLENNPYAPGLPGSPGGQMLVPELLAIEPGYESVTYQTGPQGAILRLHYPDLPNVDERNRYTYLVLDEATKRPKMVRTVSQKAGGQSSIIKILSETRVNNPLDEQVLASKSFLTTHTAAPVVAEEPRKALALVGKPAPAFKLVNFAKAPVQLSSYRGKTVLLDFWTTSCSPCIAAMPEIQHLQDEYAKQGFVVLGVLMDPKSAERAQGIMKRQRARYATVLGSEAVEAAYQLNSFPRYVLIGKNGKVVLDESGYTPQLEAAIKAALKE